MTDFTLEPDVLDPDRRPLGAAREVSTGLAPTADVPVPRRPAKETPPAAMPCEACGVPVLLGETHTGQRLMLDIHIKTYVVDWDKGTARPRLEESRGYPVHRCVPSAA